MLKLIYFVPTSHLEITKNAIFEAGGGCSDHYRECAWQTKGIGQFKPVKGAEPFIGNLEELTTLEEWRVEILIDETLADHICKRLVEAHPYEEPAFELIALYSLKK